MASQLSNMMAEMESWESATEFGIPEELWADYQVRTRSDDLYIAVLSAVFNALRIEDETERKKILADLAKTLLIYSRSTASDYLGGVDKTLNLLYCAAAFYLAAFPATATLLARQIQNTEDLPAEEKFLCGFFKRRLNGENEIDSKLLADLNSPETAQFNELISHFELKIQEGLEVDPRLFITSKLSQDSLKRFKQFNIWDCLRENAANYQFDTWQPFLMNPDAFPLWELFPSQMKAIESGILEDVNEAYSMQMPTSSGKTSLCEILIYNEVKGRGKKVLFLVPFRALASEIREGISKRLEGAGVSVVASHGGNIPTRSEGASAETADVLIITPEKFVSLVQNLSELESKFDTIICDEGHLIDDSSRGLQYELLLTKLKSSKTTQRKVIFISAILPNVDEIHKWLGGKPEALAKSDYKPVEIDFAFIVPEKSNLWRLEFNTIFERPQSYFLSKFLIQDDFRYLNVSTGRPKLIGGYKSYTSLACAAALKARRSGPVAIFTTMKGSNGVRGLAKKLIAMCEQGVNAAQQAPSISEELPKLQEYASFQFGESYLLPRLLTYGMGFHHGDLPQEIRREMEAAIQNGVINVLICTSTLAEGVNLPIRTLVVHTIKRFDGDTLQPIEQRSIKNIVGRVGRAGIETRGRIIFANNNERAEVESVFRDTHMEPAYGALFRLIKSLNNAVSQRSIQLSNEIFEAQDNSFLSIIDSIDMALIDLIPLEISSRDIKHYIEHSIEKTLAYQYCDTDELRDRVKEVFRLRTEFLAQEVPRENWGLLKSSGSSPRYWKFVASQNLVERPEWENLDEVISDEWIDNIVLRLMEMSTLEIEHANELLKQAIGGWMSGLTYGEIADACRLEVDKTLKLLGHTIGYKLQESLGKLSQLAIAHYGEDNLSELARNWSSLLQYGLGDLQQLDLFERGASDRLAVWGISRYLKANEINAREPILTSILRKNASYLISFLEEDPRVPALSIERILSELRI